MREANQKQTRVQFSGTNNEKISGWVCSLQPSDNSMGEKILVYAGGLQISPIPRVLQGVCYTM